SDSPRLFPTRGRANKTLIGFFSPLLNARRGQEIIRDASSSPSANGRGGSVFLQRARRRSEQDAKERNPKAFAFNSSVKAKRLQSRAAEKEQRRLHVPTIDRSTGELPPFIVVVQGPPKVGKSLLIKCLVKHYTKHNLSEVHGPITVVSGKQRRVQFLECPNDINGMIDAAKIADLALLLVDGSYGFEMVHIAGVGDFASTGITSLADPCPLPSAAKKKGLRDKEKLFYAPMSGLGDLLYDKDAVYININDHLVQFSKVDEETSASGKGKDRDVGVALVKTLQNTRYSIDEKLEQSFINLFGRKPPSASDDNVDANESGYSQGHVSILDQEDDDCLDDKEVSDDDEARKNELIAESESDDSDGDDNCTMDDDHVGDQQITAFSHDLKEEIEFHNGRFRRKVISSDYKDNGDLQDSEGDDMQELDDDDDDLGDHMDVGSESSEEGDEDLDSDDEGENVSKWKGSLLAKTVSRQNGNLMQLVYGPNVTASTTTSQEAHDSSESDDSDEDFFMPKGERTKKLSDNLDVDNVDTEDSSKFNNIQLKDWSDGDLVKSIRDRFVTGDWSKAAQRGLGTEDVGDNETVFGDFEDLETGEVFKGNPEDNDKSSGSFRMGDDQEMEERRLKKLALRAKFDDDGSDLSDEEEHNKRKFNQNQTDAGGYFDKLKEEIELRKQMNIAELNDLDEATRARLKRHRWHKKTGFRITATGAVQEFNHAAQIMKKAAKVELGDRPKKKGESVKEGIARCTFEDRILMSDIVFLRAWTRVEIPRFYNPVTTSLQPRDQTWKGMKTVAELRRDNNLPVPYNKDSVYMSIERKPRKFNPLVIPRKLQAALPFASKPKDKPARKQPSLESRRAVVMEPHERKVHALVQHLQQIKNEKMRKRKLKEQEKKKAYEAEKMKQEQLSRKRQREERRERYRREDKHKRTRRLINAEEVTHRPASVSSSSPAGVLVAGSTSEGFRLRPPCDSSLSSAFGSFARLALAGGWGLRGGSEMSSGELLEIDPLELQFPFELKKQISCSLQLANKSDDYVAFKVKTTSPKKYCVRPNAGVVLPRSTCVVIVTMQAQREAPPDMQCKDKFLVQSVIVDQGATTKDITTEMFSKESGNVVDEVKLRVAYVSPPQPPSPVPEGSEEGSSPRPSVSDNGNPNASELLAVGILHYCFMHAFLLCILLRLRILTVMQQQATRAYAEDIQQEKTSENLALISRLTEEKNAAIQQNSKLRQELHVLFCSMLQVHEFNIFSGIFTKELVRREVSKQQGGFSFVFVVLIALLGIFLGYLLKK
ncbi:Ribosome biogenesis protein BMS1, partial [Musa troglodytarum]